MMKIAGYVNDVWSVFFKEAFIPRTRAMRKDITIITWMPIILYFIIKYLIKLIYLLPIIVTNKAHVNALDSTKSLDDLLNLLGPIFSVVASWLALLIGLYLMFCIISLIVRRIYDMGVSIKTGKVIITLPILALLYSQSPVIITFINHAQKFFIINLNQSQLPYTGSIYTISIFIVLYLILQIVPTNMFNTKYYINNKS